MSKKKKPSIEPAQIVQALYDQPSIILAVATGDPDTELLKCPICGEVAVLDDFDCLGADEGCVFCNSCNTELAL